MQPFDLDAVAALLISQTKQTPPRIEFPDELRPETLDRGYEIQKRFELRRAAGEQAIGYKVACMTKKSQILNKITEPVFGAIRGDCVVSSGAVLETDKYVKPLIECEIMAVVDLGEDPGTYTIRNLATSLEICDFRCVDRSAEAIITDNWNNAGSVLGSFVDRWDDEALEDAAAYVIVDGKKVIERRVGEVIGSPRRTIDWLLPALAQRGREFQSGMLVSTGSLCGEIFIHAGQTVVAGIDGLGEVSITTV